MRPSRNEILQAWLTLVKIKEYYDHDRLDSWDRQQIFDVLRILDQLQQELCHVER
jgi:hypothetical protein